MLHELKTLESLSVILTFSPMLLIGKYKLPDVDRLVILLIGFQRFTGLYLLNGSQTIREPNLNLISSPRSTLSTKSLYLDLPKLI